MAGIDGIAVFGLQVLNFILDEEEMKTITALNRGWRYIVPTITASPMFSSYSCDRLTIRLLVFFCAFK